MAQRKSKRIGFTVDRLKKLEHPESGRYVVYDTDKPNLVLAVTPKAKTFYAIVKVVGRAKWIRIGAFPGVKIEKARKTVHGWVNDIAGGEDPAEKRRQARAKGRTLGDLWAAYNKASKSPRGKDYKRSWRNDELQFNKHVHERLRTRELARITSVDVARLRDRIEKDSGPVAANRVLALLSSMFTWSQKIERRKEWGDLVNPCRGVDRFDESPRSRHLLPDELRRFYEAAMNDSDTAGRDAVLMLLFTGQRKSTITGLRWSEVDFLDSVLKIPAARMKGDRDHMVPLCGPALDLLRVRHNAAEAGASFVFPSVTSRLDHLVDLRQPIERITTAAKIMGHLTPHDLRRTFATYAREAGRDPGSVLAHKPQGVTAKVYTQVTLAGLREVMRATVNHMMAKINPPADDAKVVPISKAQGA